MENGVWILDGCTKKTLQMHNSWVVKVNKYFRVVCEVYIIFIHMYFCISVSNI